MNTTPTIAVNEFDVVEFQGRRYLALTGHEDGVLIVRNRETGELSAHAFSPYHANGWYADPEHGTHTEVARVRGRRAADDGGAARLIELDAITRLDGLDAYAVEAALADAIEFGEDDIETMVDYEDSLIDEA